jgi:hypothetical protein
VPGFRNNSQQAEGAALEANATGSVRLPLLPYSTRMPSPYGGHTVDTVDFKNNGVPLRVSGSNELDAACIHVSSLSALDEIYLWASNKGTTSADLTLSFVTGSWQKNGLEPDSGVIDQAMVNPQRIVTSVRPQAGLQLVYPGIPHTNNDAIWAMSSNGDINISGFIMRRYRESAIDKNQGYDGQE